MDRGVLAREGRHGAEDGIDYAWSRGSWDPGWQEMIVRSGYRSGGKRCEGG
jgi:hypothetical protein